MAKPKGSPKTGGRKKGTPNKNVDFIGRCEELGIDLLTEMMLDMKEMLPFQRVDYWVKLIEFYYPKKKSPLEIGNAPGSEGFKLIIEDYGKK